MGKALEVLTGIVTAASATQTALTMQGGDSLTIRDATAQPGGHAAFLLQAWTQAQLLDPIVRIKSPRMHDNTQGYRYRPELLNPHPMLPWTPAPQKLFPQDTLTVDASGSSTGSDIETTSLLVYYVDLPGIDANLFMPEQIWPLVRHYVTVENTITEDTAGGYSGREALNAEFDLLKSNTSYALIGYTFFETGDLNVATIAYDAPDWGNLRLGGPGLGEAEGQGMTKDWFVRLSQAYQMPMVPVFSSGNIGNVGVAVATDENAKVPIVTTILAELGTAPSNKVLR